ncbi:MAG: alpha-xylosidase [Halanaerobiaceae bacterium]
MKFTDGYWSMKEGVDINYPREVSDIDISEDYVQITAPRRKIEHRGSTLNCMLFTITFSSPLSGIIRVKVEHFQGLNEQGPEFDIVAKTDREILEVEDKKEELIIKSGELKVVVAKKNWEITYYNQKGQLTASREQHLGYIETDQGQTYMREQLDLAVDEYVYGLGEQFTPFVKNGQVVNIWNRDGGTSTNQAYKNIPFYLTNKGYGVLVNYPGKVSYEIASENVSRVQFSVPGQKLDYYLINGPTPKKVLNKYTALTGRPALPPAWSFGLWLTTSFTTNYDEQTVNKFVEGMAERDIPLRVFHFDCFWMREFHWCNFKWDERVFPDPEGMISRLKEKGLKICVWINPYIAQQSSLFKEGKEKGYFLQKQNGDIWQTDQWQAGMAIVDFTNPEACDWYTDKLKKLLDMGVDSFKTDFGERIPTEVEYFAGSDPQKMHNYYSYLYNKVVFNLLQEEKGAKNAVVFARSGSTGSQKFPVHWGGDCVTSYASMAESLRGGLSLCLSGFGFWSHDIGGFSGDQEADIFKRWLAFGLFSSHSRLHGNSSYRVPWSYDQEAVEVARFFTKKKYELMPYIFSKACQAQREGIPLMRAMVLEYPQDPACTHLDRQYMLGDSLLVAPVFSPRGEVSYYLPEGRWTNYLSNKVVEGGRWLKEKHDYLSLPLMVAPNSVIPVGSRTDKPDYDYSREVTLHLFELQPGSCQKTEIFNQKGELTLKTEIVRKETKTKVKVLSGEQPFSVLLRNVEGIKSLEVDSKTEIKTEATSSGVEIFLKKGVNEIEITHL